MYSKRFSKVVKFIGNVAALFGANFFKEDFHMNWLTWAVILLINVAIMFTLHTLYIILKVKSNFLEALQCLCMFGTGIQGYIKLIVVIKTHREHRWLHDEIRTMYLVNEQKHAKYRKYLKNAISLQIKLIKYLFAMYSFAVVGVIGIPVVYMKFFNERLFIMPFYIPLMDPNTEIGYFSNFALHIMCVLAGGYGNFCLDCWVFLVLGHVPLHGNILECKFHDLDEVLKNRTADFRKAEPLLCDILEWHQKYIFFIKKSKAVFFWIIFSQVSLAVFGIICTVISVFLGVWPAAPIYLVYSFINLYIFCGLGNLVENANEKITFMIYDSLWYLLCVQDQKMILVMLSESQHMSGITIGDVCPLTLNTALQLTRSIYSVAMMLHQFLY